MEIKSIDGSRPVSGKYLIIENQLRTAKNGSNYLALKIADHTGEMSVKVWDADETLYQRLEVGKIIELCNIQPKLFKDQIQLEWEAKHSGAFKLVPDSEVDFSQFLPRAPGNLTKYWNYISDTIREINEPSLRKVLNVFFEDRDFVNQFIRVPAAIKRHHVYIGGLLEHTAGVTAICRAAADYYPLVNKDLLLSGAIVHDIGKTKTYRLERGFDGTDHGKLIGHLVLGVNMIEEAISALFGKRAEDLDDPILLSLVHLLVSHHGIMEWGSPVEPLTLEACILHHADNMDAQIGKFLTVIHNQDQEASWSAYDPGLGRSIFLKGLSGKIESKNLPEGA